MRRGAYHRVLDMQASAALEMPSIDRMKWRDFSYADPGGCGDPPAAAGVVS
jgi:hypothetical protein